MRCGVDEAGRGPWAGPVVAGAVVFRGEPPAGLKDSKKLSAAKRDALYDALMQGHYCGVGVATVEEIDRLNILQATFLAMRRAVGALPDAARSSLEAIWVDGNQKPAFVELPAGQVHTLVKGDDLMVEISAASILAKVTRDRMMLQLDATWPQYGFARHSGYGVPFHANALAEHGPCPEHRSSFAPIRKLLEQRSRA